MKYQKKIIIGVVVISLGASIWLSLGSKPLKSILPKKTSDWITISYSALVNKAILTHSGETIGEIIKKIPKYTDETKGLVQAYLEPYSILCHDVLLARTRPDTMPLINIIDHYPVGSKQPVWVDLFREGHYQLYYNTNTIRIFLKGSSPVRSFEKHFSVIRHPINDVISTDGVKIDQVEVYVFSNDYASTEIQLNIIPYVINFTNLDLSPRHKSIDLTSISEFLKQGVILEAVEVDGADDLYLYGRKSSRQTIAGRPISLADIAVVYRSIFHYGNNAPYISLDKHEDNRYAKVNYGGHLENTLVGDVVLEADKLFKTLGTGLDPNTHKLIKNKITNKVPGFITEDERNLLEGMDEGGMQIRYWFYPDSIGTVTDGSIGAVLTNQFMADIERMDVEVDAGNAVRETIDHLNKNYSNYEQAEKTFKELSSVGRIMALINWLKAMDIQKSVELDDFLSVELPAFTTPLKTKKMLAVTAAAYPKNMVLAEYNVGNYTKVFYISHLLEQQNFWASDKEHLQVAGNYFSQIDISELAPTSYNTLSKSIAYYEKLISSNERKIENQKSDLARKERTLNSYNRFEVDQYNLAINVYNQSLETQGSYINIFNSKVNQLNEMQIVSRCITSVGGGINLRPSEFKKTSWNRNHSKISKVVEINRVGKTHRNTSKYGNWIWNNSDGKIHVRINKLPSYVWEYSNSSVGGYEHHYRSRSGDYKEAFLSSGNKDWHIKTKVGSVEKTIQFSKLSNVLRIEHSAAKRKYSAKFSTNGRRVEFYL